MSKRKRTPAHDFWHPRVEGQIKDAIEQHPEWFCLTDRRQKETLINSLAKRIVGEIVAAWREATIPACVATNCAAPEARGVVHDAARPERDVSCAPAAPECERVTNA